MNIYDTSFENLEILRIEDKDRQEKERRFIDNTVKEMLLREKAFGHYRDMPEYFKEIGVPQRYIKAWEKVRVKQTKSLSV
jgi:NifB/MoaA-like Fe-S oxidoreductase